MTANTPKSKKGKGQSEAKAVKEIIVKEFGINPLDVMTTPSGVNGCDIYFSAEGRRRFGFGVEVKRQEKLNIPAWWEQAKKNAEKEGLRPLLVYKQNFKDRMAVFQLQDVLCQVIGLETLLIHYQGLLGDRLITTTFEDFVKIFKEFYFD